MTDEATGTDGAFCWKLQPIQQIERAAEADCEWRSVGRDPVFEIHPPNGVFPVGPVLFRMRLRFHEEVPPILHLFLDAGRGYHSSNSVMLAFHPERELRAVVNLPENLRGLRMALPPCPALFSVDGFRARRMGYHEAVLRLGWSRFRTFSWTWGGLWRALRRVFRANQPDQREALVSFFQAYQQPLAGSRTAYTDWVRLYDTLSAGDRTSMETRAARWPYRPLFSVILRQGNDNWTDVEHTLESLQRQVYQSWEVHLILRDRIDDGLRARLKSFGDRVRISISETTSERADEWNLGLTHATGEWVGFLSAGTQLSEHALYLLADETGTHPGADLVYSDEDTLDVSGCRMAPRFKPDWSPDLLASYDYMSKSLFLRTTRVKEVGGLQTGYEGVEACDLVWRILERHPYLQVHHIPHVLFHQCNPARGAKQVVPAPDPTCLATAAHFWRTDPRIIVELNPLGPWGHRVRFPLSDPNPLVSLIIPTRDKAVLLQQCVDGLRERTRYPTWELIIVNNQSREGETFRLFEQLSTDPRIRVLPYDRPFNYSAINNHAARDARGDLLCFLNNDVEMIDPEWLSEMVSNAIRPEIGAVGAKLWFPDGTLQHGGVVLGMCGWAGHLHYGLPRGQLGYEGRAVLTQNVVAVTGACLLTRRQVFNEADGFNETDLPVAFNDVDLCLRIRERGYRILWTPYAELRHHETATRGLNDTPSKRAQAECELQFMLKRWGWLFRNDPYYNPNLSLVWHDFSPAFPPRAGKPWLNPPESC